MDINKLFRSGMRTCGRVLNVLPKDEIGSPMDYMMTVLKEETLPSLDIVYPRLFKTTFGIQHLIQVNDQTELDGIGIDSRYVAYRIPSKLTEGLGIMSIKSCVPSTSLDLSDSKSSFPLANFGLWQWSGGGNYGRYSSANLYEAASYAQLNYADRQLAGQFTSAFRHYFYPPNILLILSSYVSDSLSLTCTFCLKNDENLISIEDTAYEGVKKLFLLDLKKSIYNEYGLFANIETPYGNIELKIDDWSSAESERNELYESYLATAHYRTSAMRTG